MLLYECGPSLHVDLQGTPGHIKWQGTKSTCNLLSQVLESGRNNGMHFYFLLFVRSIPRTINKKLILKSCPRWGIQSALLWGRGGSLHGMYFSFVNESKALTIYKTKKLFGGESVREKSSSTDLFKTNKQTNS